MPTGFWFQTDHRFVSAILYSFCKKEGLGSNPRNGFGHRFSVVVARICKPVFNYVVPSVVAAQLSVKQLDRVRFPGSTQLWIV